VLLGQLSIGALPPRRIAALGVARTFQVPAVFASMTVLENVVLGATLGDGVSHAAAAQITDEGRDDASVRDPRESAARSLLARVGIASLADRGCAALAYGDLKRVELAIALAAAPRLLLMDEPTAGMPPSERRQLMELVDEVTAESRLAVLFTEHDMDIVFAHADRILVLDQGRLIAAGTPSEVRADPKVQAAYLGTTTDAAEHA
jgi:branched-chain amino acid transport system ATP-binding protein